MNEADIARSLGKIEGNLEGINREIKGIKEMFVCQGKDCKECRKQIDEKIESVGDRLDDVEKVHLQRGAVLKFMNSATGMVTLVGGFVLAVFSFLIAIGVI